MTIPHVFQQTIVNSQLVSTDFQDYLKEIAGILREIFYLYIMCVNGDCSFILAIQAQVITQKLY